MITPTSPTSVPPLPPPLDPLQVKSARLPYYDIVICAPPIRVPPANDGIITMPVLPPDVLRHISHYVPPFMLLLLRRCCKQFRDVLGPRQGMRASVSDIVAYAARQGNMHLLHWTFVHQVGRALRYSSHVFVAREEAAGKGDIEMLCWLQKMPRRSGGLDSSLYRAAVRGNHHLVLEWLYANGYRLEAGACAMEVLLSAPQPLDLKTAEWMMSKFWDIMTYSVWQSGLTEQEHQWQHAVNAAMQLKHTELLVFLAGPFLRCPHNSGKGVLHCPLSDFKRRLKLTLQELAFVHK